jgi:hypothetical protein
LTASVTVERQAGVLGRQRKTAALDDAGKDPHGIQSVHLVCSAFPDSDGE